MNYEEAMAFIHCTDWKGSRLGLDRMNELMERLGRPERELKFVHVAGTNGKGSVCAFLSSILASAGYKTGMYTSPHLFRVNERMKINGTEITDERLIEVTERVQKVCAAMEDAPTEFEIITAIAFCYYAEEKCDIVVLEVGLGGRMDATNVIPAPEVAVIMNLGLEHTETLGNTLALIAGEKAGIIKSGCRAVAYKSEEEALAVLREKCAALSVPLTVADFDSARVTSRSLEGQRFDWKNEKDLFITLLGEHQIRNAVTAIETVNALREVGWSISDAALREGLARTRWEARFELLSREPLFIADGAHNPQCVEALSAGIREFLPGQKIVFLTGVLADKDYRQMMGMLLPYADSFVCLTPDSPRALDKEELAAYLRSLGFEAETAPDESRGIVRALMKAEGKPVIACGSLYMMGAMREVFPKARKQYLRKHNIAARRAISPEDRTAFDLAVVDKIRETPEYMNAQTIMSYIAVRGEVNLALLHALAERDGKRIVYPNCLDDSQMEALYPNTAESWRRGMYDIPEPIPEKSTVAEPEEIDLVLCPCTGFDEKCGRMGMGAGYYDRYLPRCVNAHVFAVAFEVQKLVSVEAEPWDVPMEAVITEKTVYRP